MASPGHLDRYGTPKAVDFSQFYVYGRLVWVGQGNAMFDRSRWESALTDVWGGPGPAYLPLYPPTIGFLFAPLAPLSFTQAAMVWTVVSLTLAAGAIWLLLRACPRLARDPITLGLLAAAWPALQQLLLVGQVSALWLLSVSVSLWAFRTARPVVAGVALGLLGLKPSLLPFAIVVLAGAGQWRALAGMTLSLAGQAAIVWIAYGPGPWAAYADVVADLVGHPERYEPSLWQAHGLLNALVLLVGRGWVSLGIYGLISLGLVVATVRRWRESPSPGGDPIACSIFVLGLLITCPHLYVYDLVIMVAALLPTLEWCLARQASQRAVTIKRLLGASYALPLFGPLVASVTHVQLSVVAFLALFSVLAQTGTVASHRNLAPLEP